MSVHYKFKSDKNPSTVTFEGSFISLAELKKAIIAQKRLGKSETDDLQVTNALTKEVYRDDATLIPKNTSVIVLRIPSLNRPAIAPKHSVQHTATIVGSRPPESETASITDGASSTQQPADEEERLQALISGGGGWQSNLPSSSTQTYRAPRYNNFAGPDRVPPPTYVCHRCNKPGHYINRCPTNGDPRFDFKKAKQPIGIPKAFLKPVTEKSEGTMLMPGGGFAVMQPNEAAFEKVATRMIKPGLMLDAKDKIPEELQCTMCKNLLKDAVLIPCCGYSFCDECIRQTLLQNGFLCPQCKSHGMSPDNLVPNKKLRDAVDSYKRTISSQKNTEPLLPSEQAPQAQQLKERELEEEMKANNEGSQMAQDHLPPTEMVTPLPPLYEGASSLAANTSEVAAVTSGTPIDHNHEDTHFKPTSALVHAQTSAEVPENMMSGAKEDESEAPSDYHHHDDEKRQTEDYARGTGRGMPEHYRPDHMHGNGPPIHMPYPHGPPIHISHYPPHHPYHPHHHHHHHHHPHMGPTGSHYPMHQGPYGPPGIPGYPPFEEAGHGHYPAEAPYMQAARGDRLCYKCGHPGHVARACPTSSPSNYEHEGRYSRTRERSDSREEADLEWRRGREADSTGKARSRSPARRHSRLRSPSPKEHRSRHQSPRRRTSRERRSRERYSPSHREHSTTKRSRSPRSRSRSRSQKRRIAEEKAEDKRDHQEKDKRLQRDRTGSTTHGEGEKRKRDKSFDERERESRPKSKEERHKHSKPDQTVMEQRSERDKDSRVHFKEERSQTRDTNAISRSSAERKVKRETQHDLNREKRPSDTKHQEREESKTRKERQTPTNGESAKENKKRRSGDPRSNSPHAHVSTKHTEDQRPSKRSRTSEKQRPTSPVQTRDHRDKKREKDIPAVAQQSKGTRVKEPKNLPTATNRGVEGDTPKLNRRTSTKKENNEERNTNPKERSDRQPTALNTRHSPSTPRHKLSGSDDNKQVTSSSSRKASQPIHKTQADKSSKSGDGSAHDGQADGASHKPGKKRRVVENKPLQNARPSLSRSTNPATSVFSESRMRSDLIGQQAKPSSSQFGNGLSASLSQRLGTVRRKDHKI